MSHYPDLLKTLTEQDGSTTLDQRKAFAAAAFGVSSQYDSAIYNWLGRGQADLRFSAGPTHVLRYGENPHQKAASMATSTACSSS